MKFTAPFVLAFFFSYPALAECVDGDCTNGQGRMKYDDGSQYIGQWKDGQRHGYGKLKLANGSEFVGDWQDDERKGRAVYIFVNRAKYAIEWTGREPQTNGQGRLTNPDTSIKEGLWVNGQFVDGGSSPRKYSGDASGRN